MNKQTGLRNFFILLGSTLSVMQGAVITPSLPSIAEHFSSVENIEFLTKLIIAIPPLFIALFSPLAGFLFEKFGRKKVLIFSALLYAVSGVSGFLFDSIYLILASRAIIGISIAGLNTGFIVIVGDLFSEDKRNKFIGIQGAAMSFGGVAYLLLGGLLADMNWSYPFLTYSISAVIALGLLLFLEEPQSADIRQNIGKIKFNRSNLIIFATAILVMIFYLMVPTQMPFLIKYNFPDFKASNIGVFVAFWILCSSIASLFYSKLRSKFNFNLIYVIGFSIWAVGSILILFANNLVLLYISLMFMGFGNGMIVPNLKANLLDSSLPTTRGRLSGYLTMSFYIGQFLSPVLVQPLINYISINAIFAMFGLVIAILPPAFYLLNRKQ